MNNYMKYRYVMKNSCYNQGQPYQKGSLLLSVGLAIGAGIIDGICSKPHVRYTRIRKGRHRRIIRYY